MTNQEILKIYAQNIYLIYNELIQKEINNENTLKTITKLKENLKIENDFYQSLNLETAKELQYFFIDEIIKNNNDKINLSRILNKIFYYSINKKTKNINYFLARIEHSILVDRYRALLCFLQEYINDSNYVYIKNILIEFKYQTIYILNSLENEYINNNCQILNTFYISNQLEIELSKINGDIIETIQENIEAHLLNTLEILIEKNDLDFSSNKKASQIIILLCLLRANMILINQESFNFFKEFLFNTNTYPFDDTTQKIISQLVKNSIINFDKDKSKTLVLSLGLNI
ncbi:MAG: hypothetical protein E7172_06065 [Firmicutes bacterium]|nr:hypothetical protein [Bacillota bacterium]